MTLREISSTLYKSSVAGYFNHTKFTRTELLNYMEAMFQGKLKNDRLTMEIALPDGWWYFIIWHYGKGADEYLWNIPETREQEKLIKDALFSPA